MYLYLVWTYRYSRCTVRHQASELRNICEPKFPRKIGLFLAGLDNDSAYFGGPGSDLLPKGRRESACGQGRAAAASEGLRQPLIGKWLLTRDPSHSRVSVFNGLPVFVVLLTCLYHIWSLQLLGMSELLSYAGPVAKLAELGLSVAMVCSPVTSTLCQMGLPH